MYKKLIVLLTVIIIGLFSISKLFIPKETSAISQEEYTTYIPIFTESSGSVTFSSFGPDGGTIVSIEIDPANPKVIYAGTWGNGVYRSPDRGLTWIHKSNGMVSGFLFDIAVDPANSSHILASTYKEGAMISFDSGDLWTQTSGFPEETVVYAFAYDPSDTDVVYAAVREKTIQTPELDYPGGIYRSIDGGKTWQKKSSGLPNDYIYDVLVDPNNTNTLYVAMHETGVYKSTNGAKTWFSVNNNIHYRDVRSLDINPISGTLYAAMYDGKGVAFTRDGGQAWSTIADSVNKKLYVYSLQLDPKDYKSLYLTGPDGLFRCTGNPYPSGSSACSRIAHSGNYVFSVAVDYASPTIYLGYQDGCLFKSTNDGESFARSFAGIKANVITSVINDPTNPKVFYASALGQGLYKSINNGETWMKLTNGAPNGNINKLVFRPGNSNVIYAATQTEGIFISTDGGTSWLASNSGMSKALTDDEKAIFREGKTGFEQRAYFWMDPVDIEELKWESDAKSSNEKAAYPEILSISMDPNNTANMVAGTSGYGILKSNNAGSTWTATSITSGTIYDFMVDLSQPQYIHYAGLHNLGIRKSDVNRNSWSASSSGFHSGADVFALTSDGSGVYFAATDNGVYKTTDAAQNWSRVGLAGIALSDIYIDPVVKKIIWATSEEGLYRSVDGGLHWSNVGTQYLNKRFLSISQGYGAIPIFFGMAGGNIWTINE